MLTFPKNLMTKIIYACWITNNSNSIITNARDGLDPPLFVVDHVVWEITIIPGYKSMLSGLVLGDNLPS